MSSVFNYSIFVNNKPLHSKQEVTILQFLESSGIHVPRFCYHKQLTIAGNCRMCLVEVAKSIKPVIACGVGILDQMSIYTDSHLVKKAREGVLEFLLINHPLDCPICDQGGECDLQDQSLIYGSDRGRFIESKRSVEDKNFGPLIKTVMTRCIHCTRCIRFANEVAGYPFLGTMGRGVSTEVSSYIDKFFNSEISGNVIDLCPVGALTSKPYAFVARPWELYSIESIDVLDSLGSNIRLDLRGSEIVRVLPKLNPIFRVEWISDNVRFSYDALNMQRILTPFKTHRDWGYSYNKLLAMTNSNTYVRLWAILTEISNYKYTLSLGNYLNINTILTVKSLCNSEHITLESDCNRYNYSVDFRRSYLAEYDFFSFSKVDSVFLLDIPLKRVSPVFNSFLKKWTRKHDKAIYYIGRYFSFNYPIVHLAYSLSHFVHYLLGKNLTSLTLKRFNKPCIIASVFGQFLRGLCNYLNVAIMPLHLNTNTLHLNELNCNSESHVDRTKNLQFHLNTSKLTTSEYYYVNYNSSFALVPYNLSIYLGHHAPMDNMMNSLLMLPISSFYEDSGYFLNNFGMLQESKKALSSSAPSIIESIYNICDVFGWVADSSTLSKSFNYLNKASQLGQTYNLNADCASNFFYITGNETSYKESLNSQFIQYSINIQQSVLASVESEKTWN